MQSETCDPLVRGSFRDSWVYQKCIMEYVGYLLFTNKRPSYLPLKLSISSITGDTCDSLVSLFEAISYWQFLNSYQSNWKIKRCDDIHTSLQLLTFLIYVCLIAFASA